MPRYKTETRPGLVALYGIRPGNGQGQFLQPCSPHGAVVENIALTSSDAEDMDKFCKFTEHEVLLSEA